jgi:hypothetical protein
VSAFVLHGLGGNIVFFRYKVDVDIILELVYLSTESDTCVKLILN